MGKNILLTMLGILISTQNCLAGNIQFSELHPNPTGKDNGKEWIELHNITNTAINLKNWQIIQSKKAKTIKTDTIIQAQGYYALNLVLRNQDNNLKLLDPNGRQRDQTHYEETKEGLSLSKIQQEWYWTNPTRNQPNPKIEKISGKAALDTQGQLLIGDQKIAVQNINPLLLRAAIKKEKTADATILKGGSQQELIKLEIQNTATTHSKKQPSTLLINLLLILITAVLALTFLYKSFAPAHRD